MSPHADIEVIISTTSDGSLRSSLSPEPLIEDRATSDFLTRNGIRVQDSVLLRLSYDTDDFLNYHTVTDKWRGHGFTAPQESVADALATQASGVALFLAIADCVGAVIYDPYTRSLMLSHLGRHNLEQQGGQFSVAYLTKEFGVKPANLHVYLSPAAAQEYYPLYVFDNRSLHDVATQQLMQAGVKRDNIIIDTRDTVKDPGFFSHSAALRGDKPHGRHAIVCYIKP